MITKNNILQFCIVKNPIQVESHSCVDSGDPVSAAEPRPEAHDADDLPRGEGDVVDGGHEGGAGVAHAAVLALTAAGAHLLQGGQDAAADFVDGLAVVRVRHRDVQRLEDVGGISA